MKYGLSEKQLKEITDILVSYEAVEKAILFGSRAIDTYKEASDVDIAIKGENADWSLALTIKDHLEEETYLPFFFDVVAYGSIESEALKRHIDGKGKVLFCRESEGLMENGELIVENEGSAWREKPLKEVARLRKDSWKVGQEPLPYIALEHIVEGGLRIQGIGDSATIASNKYRFSSDNFLFGKLRPYFRKLYKPDFDGICSTDIWVVEPKDDNSKDYLFYFFANQEFIDLSYSGSSGTRMPRADWKFISEQKWDFPPLPEQKAIAEVLSVLDDKIDLLHRQNKTLEQMAETLFRQWFVVEAGEDWEEKPLSSVANFLNGLACQKFPPKNEVDKLPVLKIKQLRNGFSDDSDWCTTEVKPEYIIENGDVIFSWSASLMVKIWDGKQCILNQHLFKVTSNDFPKWYYYLWSKHHLAEFVSISSSHATTMGHIKRGDLDDAMVLVPSPKEIEFMTNEMQPLIDKQITNAKQIHTLQSLRDILLPKLMSGEIRVKYNDE